jgi:hypothetical protein
MVLDQQEGSGRAVRDLREHVPRGGVAEDRDSVGRRLGPGHGARLESWLAGDSQAEQRADLAAELDRLVRRQVAEVHGLHLPVGVLVHGERVDHANRVALLQPLQLRDDLAVEVRIPESEHDELDRSYRHGFFLSSAPAIRER